MSYNGQGGNAYSNLVDMNALAKRNNSKPKVVRLVTKKYRPLPLV